MIIEATVDQRSMTSRGYDPRQSPGLGYKRVVSCKDSFHGTDSVGRIGTRRSGTAPEHPRTIRRSPKGGRPRYLPTRAAEADRSTLIADIPFPAPGNVAAKRCASEKRAF